MNSGRIPLAIVTSDTKNVINRALGKKYSSIELCRIEEVDTTNKVVSAYFFESGKSRSGVPYCYPYYNNGCGIIFVPTRGALGIAAWDASGVPTIISFTAPATVTNSGTNTRNMPQLSAFKLPDLLEGEMIISSPTRSFIKFDKLGGLTLSSALFGYITLDEHGGCSVDIETGDIRVNGVLEETYTENYEPVLKVVKGKHQYLPVQQSDSVIELCYRISVFKEDKEVSFVGIGTDGNIHIGGQKIITHKEGS